MQKAKLDEYIEQGRIIEHKDANLLFWKKDGRIEVECQGRFKATADTYRFPDNKALVFSNKAGDGYGGTDYNDILITETTLDDLTIYDELFGRVFASLYNNGTETGIYYFVFARITYDQYKVMRFDDEGCSECLTMDAKDIYDKWHKHQITALSADGSTEILGGFIKTVTVVI